MLQRLVSMPPAARSRTPAQKAEARRQSRLRHDQRVRDAKRAAALGQGAYIHNAFREYSERETRFVELVLAFHEDLRRRQQLQEQPAHPEWVDELGDGWEDDMPSNPPPVDATPACLLAAASAASRCTLNADAAFECMLWAGEGTIIARIAQMARGSGLFAVRRDVKRAVQLAQGVWVSVREAFITPRET